MYETHESDVPDAISALPRADAALVRSTLTTSSFLMMAEELSASLPRNEEGIDAEANIAELIRQVHIAPLIDIPRYKQQIRDLLAPFNFIIQES